MSDRPNLFGERWQTPASLSRRRAGYCLLLGALLVTACSRGGDKAPATSAAVPSSNPRVAISATVAGITNLPQTPRPTAETLSRDRAEAFLTRITPTSADLPPTLQAGPATARDRSQLAALDPNAALLRQQYDAWGLTLSLESPFAVTQQRSPAPNGEVLRVTDSAVVFASADGAKQYLSALGPTMSQRALLLIKDRIPTVNAAPSRATDLPLGEESVAWYARDPASGSVGWAIAARRGPAVYLLLLDGTGAPVDELARALAMRLDQRLAAALSSGAP